MGAKTTPQPWELRLSDPEYDSHAYVVWADKGTAVVAHIPNPGQLRLARNADEADANAKLIAAAPALADDAEKLTALLAHLVEYSHYETDLDLPSDILKRIEDEARAVAKAVGYDGYTCAALRLAGRLP